MGERYAAQDSGFGYKTPLTQWENGMQHKIPVSATFNLFKYINIVPSFNYTERWYLRKVKQSYDASPTSRDHVKRDTINGFNRLYATCLYR